MLFGGVGGVLGVPLNGFGGLLWRGRCLCGIVPAKRVACAGSCRQNALLASNSAIDLAERKTRRGSVALGVIRRFLRRLLCMPVA